MYLPPIVKQEEEQSSSPSPAPQTRSPSLVDPTRDLKIPQGHFGNLLCESYPGMIHIKEDRNSPSGRLKWNINFTFATGSEMWDQVNEDLIKAESELSKALRFLEKSKGKKIVKKAVQKHKKQKKSKKNTKKKSKKMRN